MAISKADVQILRNYEPVFKAYCEYVFCSRAGKPKDVMIDHEVMRGYEGDIYSRDGVRDFLVGLVENDGQDSMRKIFAKFDRGVKKSPGWK